MSKVKFAPLQINNSLKVLAADTATGETMASHSADKDAVFMVMSGKVQFSLDEAKKDLEKNDSINIPKNTSHSFEVLEGGRCMLILDANAKITFSS